MKGGWVYIMTNTAIQREKNMKHWPRVWKLNLIAAQNPLWEDLFNQLNV
jgi:putative endonuclease